MIEPTVILTEDEESIIETHLNELINDDGLLKLTIEYHNVILRQHIDLCCYYLIPCPYWHTQCCWIDILPLISEHIRKVRT